MTAENPALFTNDSTKIRQALGYLRRSVKSDARVVSLEMQRDAVAAYCGRHGLTLGDVLEHDGISGGQRDRFAVIEDRRRAIGATALVVYDLDRLARDNAGLLDYLEQLERRGVALHETISGLLDYRTAEGVLMAQVRGALNEFTRRQISRRNKATLRYLRDQGRQYTGIPPLGWRYENRVMVEVEEEQNALAIISRCAAAGHGRVRTLKTLRAAGYNGRGSLATIQKLLTERERRHPPK